MAASEIKIEKANSSDAPAIVALVNYVYRGEAAKKSWTSEAGFIGGIRVDAAKIQSELINPAIQILLAKNQHAEIIGCVKLERSEAGVYLGMLSVHLNQQKSGLGGELVKAAEKFVVHEWHLKKIFMHVLSCRSELIAWYQRKGYRDSGKREPWPYEDKTFGVPTVDNLEFFILEKLLPAN